MNQSNMLFNILLGQLQNKNPKAYMEFSNLMNSGKNPEQVLNELLQSGRFTANDVNQVKNYLNKQNTTNTNNPKVKRF